MTPISPGRGEADAVLVRLGSWSGIGCAVTSVAFLVAAFGVRGNAWNGDLAAYGATFSPVPMIATVVPSLLIVPAFLGLMAAIHASAPARLKAVTLLAFALATMYGVIVGTSYALQLGFVRPAVLAGRAASVALLLMENPQGYFWPVESFGYGLQGVALGLAALVFDDRGLTRLLRWSCLLVGLGGALSLVSALRGPDPADPLFIAGGAAWGVGLPLAGVLAAVFFRRLAPATK